MIADAAHQYGVPGAVVDILLIAAIVIIAVVVMRHR